MSLLFKVTYQNEEIPPPYKHRYSIEVHSTASALKVFYQLEYLDRETIDEEDIFAEGFTLEDDYKWEGELKPVWKLFLAEFLKKTSFKKIETNSNLSFQLPNHQNAQIPFNLSDWEYTLQELTQAIFEEGGREAPLELTFAEIARGSKQIISFLISFSERTLTLIENKNGKNREKKVNWSESKNLMNTVYSIKYIGERALLKPPKKEGKFIDIGEGAWYELGVAALNPDKKANLLEKLENLFKSNL